MWLQIVAPCRLWYILTKQNITKMKISKKLGLLVLALIAIPAIFFGLSINNKAQAAPISASDFASYPYTVTGFSNGKIDTLKVTIAGKDYFFIDKNTKDDGNNLKYYGKAGPICQMEQNQGAPMNGITIDSGPFTGASGQGYFQAHVSLGYSGDTNVDCDENGAQNFIDENDNPPQIKVTYRTALPGAPTPSNNQPPAAGSTKDEGDGGETSACVFQTNQNGIDISLEWILCPVITGLSKSADGINKFVEGQLIFDTNENLSGSVHKAWGVFRTLASSLIVIVLLVMVISQAIGGGPFEAYTVKKLLPRLVAAIIIMQVSWELCIWLIQLSNAAGKGIGQLMAAPFGGPGNLDLGSLLQRLSGVWAAIISATTVVGTAGIVYGLFFSGALLAWGWPIMLLGLCYVLAAIVVAMATLLFRNALIILLVILSPLAFLAFVVPGADRFWKIWRENFTKLLVFFPLVIAVIYAGRIFAWTAGNLGQAGPLDVIMVLAGFFGPYFFLPKTFKLGGNVLSMANKAISESWPVKKGLETANKELMRRQLGNMNTYGKARLNPKGDPDYFRHEGLKKFAGIPYGFKNKKGKLGHTLLVNAASGRVIPTRRALGQAIANQDKNAQEEDALEEAIAKRGRDKRTGSEMDIAAGKRMSMNMVEEGMAKALEGRQKGDLYKTAGGERTAKAGIRDLIRTSSFLELAKMRIVDPEDGREKFIWQTDMWRNTVAPDGELYGKVGAARPDWKPHRLPSGLPKYRGELDPGYKENIAKNTTEELRRQGKTEAEIQAEIPRRIKSAEDRAALLRSDEELQYAAALTEVVAETDSRDLQGLNPVFFERVGQMAEQGVTYLKQAAQTTDPAEAARLRQKGELMVKPAMELRGFFQRLAATGNQFQLGNVMGGGEAEGLVDFALQYTNPDLKTVNLQGKGPSLVQIVSNQGYSDQMKATGGSDMNPDTGNSNGGGENASGPTGNNGNGNGGNGGGGSGGSGNGGGSNGGGGGYTRTNSSATRSSTVPDGTTVYLHPSQEGSSQSTRAMQQAAEALTEVSYEMRRTTNAQSQLAKRLGPLVTQQQNQGGVTQSQQPAPGESQDSQNREDTPPASQG